VVGSDYPFMPDAPGAILRHMTGLSRDDLERIGRDNARVLLGDRLP
jgi:predicted TIM-barrel fold metal-dependent hydrolase